MPNCKNGQKSSGPGGSGPKNPKKGEFGSKSQNLQRPNATRSAIPKTAAATKSSSVDNAKMLGEDFEDVEDGVLAVVDDCVAVDVEEAPVEDGLADEDEVDGSELST